VLSRVRAGLDAGKPARALGLSDEDRAAIRDLVLLTLKPVMYVANVLEDGFSDNPHLDAVRARALGEGAEVVPVSAAIEEELSQLEDEDRDAFLADLGLDEPGLNRVIRAETIGYDDFIKYRGESGARDAGRLRLEGKEYRVQEGDVLHFRFNV
jgi:ribosome-binding ATPase YchF (GTP1/OBG family)